MKVNIVTTAYNSIEYLRKLIHTSQLDADKHDILLSIFLHSREARTIEVIQQAINDQYPILFFAFGENRGLARSWNDGLLHGYYNLGADVVIIANDDIYFSPRDVDKIAQKAVQCRGNYMVSVAGYHDYLEEHRVSHGYSCFAMNPIALEKIGCFDENLFPAYMEDIDNHRRATLAGLVEENCADTNVIHEGSCAIRHDAILSLANMKTQMANQTYFRIKWDSDSHLGGYPVPFNNPKFDLRIDPETRHAPYPGYNRNDISRGL